MLTHSTVFLTLEEFLPQGLFTLPDLYHAVFQDRILDPAFPPMDLDSSNLSKFHTAKRGLPKPTRKYYLTEERQNMMAKTFEANVAPYIIDRVQLTRRLSDLVLSDDRLSPEKKEELCHNSYNFSPFVAKIIAFSVVYDGTLGR